MNPQFEDVFTSPENSIHKVVFFPDRIYHAQYLIASRSPRYRYNVREVRGKLDTTVMKGEVYLDGAFYCNFVRLEHRSTRVLEGAREKRRQGQREMLAWVRLLPTNAQMTAEATVKLHLNRWVDAYEVEIWETLEPPPTGRHDLAVLDQMGRQAPITRVKAFVPALRDLKGLRRLEVAFRENDRDTISGFKIVDPAWDNNYFGSHQEPRNPNPSSPENTVEDKNYLIDFRRGWFFHADDVEPVRYRNAMMDEDNPDAAPDNVIAMRWLLQREFGTSVVFFHEVTIEPGKVEGTHRHIGSEELYYIVQGEGIAYMGEGDDPDTDAVNPETNQPLYETVERDIYGTGTGSCKALPIRPGCVIFTKSGGIHGIRNTGPAPLKFVAFLYHTS